MSAERIPVFDDDIVYPESDGKPMADNMQQWECVTYLKNSIEALFRHDPDVLVAGDLLWYPVWRDNKTCAALDAMVVFGRPKGLRGCYRQWDEGDIAPQVVFEVLSPNNTAREMLNKLRFYDRYDVEEYYLYDPETAELWGWQRAQGCLQSIPQMEGWVSPRLGVQLDTRSGELRLIGPGGEPLATWLEMVEKNIRVTQERDTALRERDAVVRERDAERERSRRLEERLRALGIDPEEA